MIRNPSPLDRLHGRRAIGDKEYSALKRYYHHWHCAGLQSAVGSVDLNRVFASDLGSMSGMAKSEKQFYHRQQYRSARCLIGHRPGIVVDNVVCCEWSLEIGGFGIGYTSPYRARQAAIRNIARFWVSVGDILGNGLTKGRRISCPTAYSLMRIRTLPDSNWDTRA